MCFIKIISIISYNLYKKDDKIFQTICSFENLIYLCNQNKDNYAKYLYNSTECRASFGQKSKVRMVRCINKYVL